MARLRRTLCFVLCFSVFLIVCAVPVSAGVLDEISGVISLEPETFGMRDNSLTTNTRWGWQSAPASFVLEDIPELGLRYAFKWQMATALTGIYSTVTNSGKELTVIINVGDGSGFVDVYFEAINIQPYFAYVDSYQVRNYADFTMTGSWEFGVDGEQVLSGTYDDNYFNDYVYDLLDWSGSVSRYLYFTFYFDDQSVNVIDIDDANVIYQSFDITTSALTLDGRSATIDDLSIMIKNIEEDVEQIRTTVINIEEGVANIENTVTDMSEQLQDSDSNIWQAAGEKISETITDLFVPSVSDIEEVKQDFDDLAQDKLGGAYTAMETVENTITEVNDKLNNPSAAEGVEFPGIAVPLGGDVGTVVLAERQMVTLPTRMTAILHPIAGTIISIICGLGTFNVLKDMVECFLSGFSYAAYLHRNKGGSDE